MSNETVVAAVETANAAAETAETASAIPTDAPAAEPSPQGGNDFAEVVEQVEGQAESVPTAEVKPFRGLADVMPANIEAAAESLALPEVQGKLLEHFDPSQLAGLINNARNGAAVLCHLSRLARKDRTDTEALFEAMDKATLYHDILSPMVASGVAQGLIPSGKAKVLPARKGRSYQALGGRVIELAMLLKKHAPGLKGRFVIEDSYLDSVIEVGTTLQEGHAKRRARIQKRRNALAQRRDRVYTWLSGQYEEVRRVGAFLFGAALDRYVPPLGSHKVSRRKAEDAAALAPVVPLAPAAAAPANSNEAKAAATVAPAAA